MPCPRPRFADYLPIFKWVPKYNVTKLRGDIVAGLTVGLMVVPQSLAYASIAGLPPEYGLYAAMMGPFVYTLLGSAKDITLGPTAIMSLIVNGALSGLTKDSDRIAMAVGLSFVAGCLQVIMGLLRLGFIVDFVSFPVISGFTSSAAISIAFGQVKHIFGLQGVKRDFIDCVSGTFSKLSQWEPYDFAMGITCIFVLLGMKHLKKRFGDRNSVAWFVGTARNAIVVVVAGLIGYALLETDTLPACEKSKHNPHYNYTAHCMTYIGNMTKGLPPPDIPGLTDFGTLASRCIVVALVGYLESIAIGKAFARQNNYVVDASQELIAIGGSNIVGSFFDAYPATGSFSRTAVNSASGVATPAGGALTGTIVLLAAAFMTQYFYYIPYAALSAVIMSAVITMFEWEVVPEMWRVSKLDLLPLLASFFGCLFYNIEGGMLIAMGLSLLILVVQHFHAPAPEGDDEPMPALPARVVCFRLRGFNFPAVNVTTTKVETRVRDEHARALVLDARRVRVADFTAVQAIGNFADLMHHRGGFCYIANASPRLVKQIEGMHIHHINIVDSLAAGVVSAAADVASLPAGDEISGEKQRLLETMPPEHYASIQEASHLD